MTDPYKVLGISPQASDEEVKTAYRKLSQQP
ncbi:MAG: J domain-containing protein, partial [Oscillospiraceae bacterium]|nr:J domain-containing protein [Oscillospiraceae bacterium]